MLIALTGYKRSGKDTLADALCSVSPKMVKARPFAIFKEALGQWFGFDEEQMNGSRKEEIDMRWGFSPRQIFQVFGTEIMKRDLSYRIPLFGEVTGNMVWARVFTEWFNRQDQRYDYVVADWRFPEEQLAMNLLYTKVVFVKVESERWSHSVDKHSSEAYIDVMPVDYVAHNNGSMEEVHVLARRLLWRIKNNVTDRDIVL